MSLSKKLTISLPGDVHQALARLANTQLRDVPQQAAWLVMQAVRQWEAGQALDIDLDPETLYAFEAIEGEKTL